MYEFVMYSMYAVFVSNMTYEHALLRVTTKRHGNETEF